MTKNMKTPLQTLQRRLNRQLRKIEARIRKALGQANPQRLAHLMAQLRRLEQRLASSSLKAATGTAALALALAGSPQEADAQAFASPVVNPFNIGNVFYAATPYLMDIDRDGDLDMFSGEFYGDIMYFRNTGTATAPAFLNPPGRNIFNFTEVDDVPTPYLVDIDGDNDLDAFVGNKAGHIAYFRNVGSNFNAFFEASSMNPFGLASVGGYSEPALVDIDYDGDLDMFIGTNTGDIVYYENTGTSRIPAFGNSAVNPFGLVNVGGYSSPALVDIDKDGDYDAYIGISSGATVYMENTGTTGVPAFGPSSVNPFGLSDVNFGAAPAFADLDGDSDLDALIGDYPGNFHYFQNTAPVVTPPSVTLTSASSGNVYGPVVVDITFSEDVAGLMPWELELFNATWSNPVTLSASQYRITLRPIVGGGMGIRIPAKHANSVATRAANTVSNYLFFNYDAQFPTCQPIASNSDSEWIQRVKLLDGDTPLIDNISGNDGGYADFGPQLDTAALDKNGVTYQISVFRGFKSGTETREQAFKAWIDFNRDGDFLDAGENIFSRNLTTATISRGFFTVPSGATRGLTRMRVQMKHAAVPFAPCESFAFGETEDYTVRIFDSETLQREASPLSKGQEAGAAGVLSVYPNPASGTAQLQFEGKASVAVFSLDGRLVHQAAGENGYALDVSGLEAGLYVVAVTDELGMRQTAKLAVE
jgi:hypothetical protein